jgi:anaerobic ribonucleoside-triphosphate reductase
MNKEELDIFLEIHPEIEWKLEDSKVIFRHTNLDKEDECIEVLNETIDKITADELYKTIINGRNIDHITRVCGYFSRVSGWNKSKIGELRDRHRETNESV